MKIYTKINKDTQVIVTDLNNTPQKIINQELTTGNIIRNSPSLTVIKKYSSKFSINYTANTSWVHAIFMFPSSISMSKIGDLYYSLFTELDNDYSKLPKLQKLLQVLDYARENGKLDLLIELFGEFFIYMQPEHIENLVSLSKSGIDIKFRNDIHGEINKDVIDTLKSIPGLYENCAYVTDIYNKYLFSKSLGASDIFDQSFRLTNKMFD